MFFCHYCTTIESTLGLVVLDVKVNQCRTFSVTSDSLTLDISLGVWIHFGLRVFTSGFVGSFTVLIFVLFQQQKDL